MMIGVEGTPAIVPVEAKKTEPAVGAGKSKEDAVVGAGNGAKNPLEAPGTEVKPQQPTGGAPAEAPKAPAGERPLKY